MRAKKFFYLIFFIFVLALYQNCSSFESNKITINSETLSVIKVNPPNININNPGELVEQSMVNEGTDLVVPQDEVKSEGNDEAVEAIDTVETISEIMEEAGIGPLLVPRQYDLSDEVIQNPDRGWYVFTSLLASNNYKNYVQQGYRLAYSALTLGAFINKAIDQPTLTKINDKFRQMREAGIKAVLRVNYSERDGGPTAGFEQMEEHMRQLKPIIEKNKDAIAYIEAGYMGPWGEWHFYEVPNPPFRDVKSSWKKIIDLLLANNPVDKFIMIRYPSKKEEIFSGQNISAENAFSSDDIARVGHHNDCFVSSNDDVGTYQLGHSSYSKSIEEQKNYLEKDTKFSPIGGESCALHERSQCSIALAELKRFGYSYLNAGYFTAVINRWKSEGCYDEINKKLGYRLSVSQFSAPETLIMGQKNKFSLELKNTGFSRVWYLRPVYLRGIYNNQEVFKIKITDFDLRDLTTNLSQKITFQAQLPDSLPENISLTLWLPDNNERNHGNPNYSIRLANKNIWNSTRGDNILIENINVNK